MGCLRLTYSTELRLLRGCEAKLPREEKACRAELKSGAETGLYYYGARYYDPSISLWLSVDPLAGYNPVMEVEHYIDGQHNGGVFNSFNHNTYGYCYQNPVLYVDPNGKQSKFWTRTVGGLKAIGGGLEMVAGGALLLVPEPTMATKVGGVIVAAHGADTASSGLKQMWTGEDTSSLTSQGLQAAGMSKQNADIVDASISIIGTGGAGAVSNASKVSAMTNISRSGFTVNPSKFDYFFGKVVTGDAHNVARSAQNLKDFTKMGIKNENQLIKVFDQAFEKGTVISTKTNQYGTSVMKNIKVGNNGSVDVGFFYKGGNMNSAPTVSTAIPKTW